MIDNYVQCTHLIILLYFTNVTDCNIREGDTTFDGFCYSDAQCQNDEQTKTFFFGFSGCCGDEIYTDYYSLTNGGDCLPCKEVVVFILLMIVLLVISSLMQFYNAMNNLIFLCVFYLL